MNPEQPLPNQKNCITDIPGELQHIIESFYSNDTISYLGHWNTNYMLHWNKSKLSIVTHAPTKKIAFRNRDGTYLITKVNLRRHRMDKYVKFVSSNATHLCCRIRGYTIELVRFRYLQYVHLGDNVLSLVFTLLKRMPDLKDLYVNIEKKPTHKPSDRISVKKVACNYGAIKYFNKINDLTITPQVDHISAYKKLNKNKHIKRFRSILLIDYKYVIPMLSKHIKHFDASYVYNINSFAHNIKFDYVCNVFKNKSCMFPDAKHIRARYDGVPFSKNVKEVDAYKLDIGIINMIKNDNKHNIVVYSREVVRCTKYSSNVANMTHIPYEDVTPNYPKNIWSTNVPEYYVTVPKMTLSLYQKLLENPDIYIVTDTIDCGNITIKLDP